MNINFKGYQLKVYALIVEIEQSIREEPYNENVNDFDNSVYFKYEQFVGIYSEKEIAEYEFKNLIIYDFFSQLDIPDIYVADLILYEITMNQYEEGQPTEIKRKNLLKDIE